MENGTGLLDLLLVPLADRPQLSEQCIELLNEEWPKSRTARQVSISKALRSSPPMAYVLVDGNGMLIGHARLCPLNASGKDCWVESVVIWKAMRGRGFGKVLMELLEKRAREHGFVKVCLSTTDKAGFYRSCAYLESEDPITNYGANALLFSRLNGVEKFLKPIENAKTAQQRVRADTEQKKTINLAKNIPPPPPPPPTLFNNCANNCEKKLFMYKMLL